ncbi:MAG TPA: SRPBCC domain-containing protein [Bacteroidia bacterium]|jgi:uncharacterized protein YndB with AHSA1/START domain|nr:SRPBCC domain-containing protein [Bacteroidia bacterium]
MKTIKKIIDINTSKENVWKVLTEDKYNRQWYAEFMEGTYAVTDWKENSKVIFKDPKGSGMVGKIVSSKPQELLSIEYTGMLLDNKEDYQTKDALQIKGGREIYALSGKDNHTQLAISGDMPEEFFNTMSKAWDKALDKLKLTAENL